MTSNQPTPNDRLNRIEEALDNERLVIADLRASVEILRNTADSQNLAIAELRATAEALLQVAQIHQRDIEALSTALGEHRRDGHGGESSQ